MTPQNALKIMTLCIPLAAFAPLAVAGSRAGNGGETKTQILEYARLIVVEGLEDLMKRPRTNLARYCQKRMLLSAQQADDCADFIWQAAPQIIAHNRPRPWNPLVVNAPGKELPVEFPNKRNRCFDADGDVNCFSADAATINAYDGPIIFRHDFLAGPQATMRNLVALMFHEFGHKVRHDGQFLEDEDPGRSFPYAWQLLDAAASGFTAFVEEKRNLDGDPVIVDRFRCETRFKGRLIPANPDHDIVRRFTGTGAKRFSNYVTGFCIGEPNCPYVPVTEDGRKLVVRMQIVETRDCRAPRDASAMAKHTFEIVRFEKDGKADRAVSVATYEEPFANPICTDDHTPLRLSYDDFDFSCRFVESFVANKP